MTSMYPDFATSGDFAVSAPARVLEKKLKRAGWRKFLKPDCLFFAISNSMPSHIVDRLDSNSDIHILELRRRMSVMKFFTCMRIQFNSIPMKNFVEFKFDVIQNYRWKIVIDQDIVSKFKIHF